MTYNEPPDEPTSWQQPPVPGPYPPGVGYPPPGYPPAYGYGYGYAPRDHPQGTTVLVLGILSLVLCGILGPVAWIMGNKTLKEIDAQPGVYGNRGNVQAGRIIGIVATALLAAGLLFYGLIFVLIAGSTVAST